MIYIFILRWWRLCDVGIQSERVRKCLSSVAVTLFWSSETTEEHTRGADRSAWVTSGCLHSLEGPADLYPSLEWPVDLCLQSKITDLILFFKFQAEVWASSSPHVFFCWLLVMGTYILPFFPVICWLHPRTEICVTLSIGDKLHSLSGETTLLMLSCSHIESPKFIVASSASLLQ